MSRSAKNPKAQRTGIVTVRNFYRDFDIQIARTMSNGNVFLDVREGDLVVRKFYRPKVLKVTGVVVTTRGQRVLMQDEQGEELWERPVELMNQNLYSIHAMPDVERAARVVAQVTAARVGPVA